MVDRAVVFSYSVAGPHIYLYGEIQSKNPMEVKKKSTKLCYNFMGMPNACGVDMVMIFKDLPRSICLLVF